MLAAFSEVAHMHGSSLLQTQEEKEGLPDGRALRSYTTLSCTSCHLCHILLMAGHDKTLKGRGLCRGEY